ncbi:MAG: DUF1624 domain-containing protein, partial [Bacteroidia bacterium]|nr:DUF1624 domain-containing protein [Bacteroidia bacterium]
MAIFAMIAANMASHNYIGEHPFLFRLFGSFAAPTFVFLSGFMVPYTTAAKKYSVWYFLKRGFAVICVAALIDIALWGLCPFVSYDVLYMIGLSLPVAFLFTKVNKWVHLAFCVLIFCMIPFIQQFFGYADLPTEIELSEGNVWLNFTASPILKHFLCDGWFPLFPWIAVSLLGSFFGRLRQEKGPEKVSKPFMIVGSVLVIIGIADWVLDKPLLITRENYSELFYPPTWEYFSVYIGSILILLPVLYKLRNVMLLHFFAVYGRSSLLMYILHTVFIVFFFNVNFETKPFIIFAQLFFMNAFFLWWIALFVQILKDQVKRLPFVLRFVIGG